MAKRSTILLVEDDDALAEMVADHLETTTGANVRRAAGAEDALRTEADHPPDLLLTDLLAWAGTARTRSNVLHWRTAGGAEVDFVIELPDRLLPIEVKASPRVNHRDARHLRTFLTDYPNAPGALLLYDGDEVLWMGERILAAPWQRVI